MAALSTTLSLTTMRRISPAAMGVGICLAVIIAWMLAPIWGVLDSAVLGDPRTDAVRGMWGFHHLSQGWLHPTELLYTTRVNFPAGAYAVVLPLATGLLLGPLGLALGPIIAWNLGLALVIWATGMAVAWLGRVLTDAWLPGLLAAAVLLAQPMFHHAIADGTVEHVALWSVPLFLGAALLTLREQSVRWAFAAGALSVIVAVDSPYNAVYALVIGLAVFPWALRWIRGRERDVVVSLVTLAGFAAFGSGLVLALFAPTGVGEPSEYANRLQAYNATDLRLWWHYLTDAGSTRDPTRPPTLITTPVLIITTAFGLFGGRRAWPWLGIGWLMIGLSFGLSKRMPSDLGLWLGEPAGALGEVILAFNSMAYDLPVIGGIRFPRRWLTPAAMALALGAAHGIAKLQSRRPLLTHALTLIAIGAVLQNGVATSHMRTDFPLHSLPEIAFADWIAQDDTDGAVLLLPHVRTTRPDATRDDLPVFARLGRSLSSADDLYLQIRFNRAMVPYPNLQTLAPVEQDKNVRRLLRDWSDLSHPQTAGQGIPPSALDRGADFERRVGIKILRQSGLRWVAIDLGAYNDEGLAEIERMLSLYIIDDRLFEEGDGVRVLTLR
jgi:hypothetical protein